ncbi:hypothetical protein AURDEDRAFT_169922 [Auricularia subglabra TFB-10046 SS5]|uniref:Cytochrome P450 n=1 Tax=Auricularia subglabra (strain TFB-10046 / SS5) TaxID=717982 RepID=J0WYE3_AURST|nr:hypothetical protein AURDEDRAFT_169922 [Auricularia subglabra TFB-10046 SS5]
MLLLASSIAIGAMYCVSTTYRTYQRNKQAAIASGLPYICVPVNTWSPLWQVLGPIFARICDRLPFQLGSWVQDVRPAWTQKNDLHAKHGPVFMVITPWSMGVHVTDPDAVIDIVTRRTDFPKPSHLYKIIDVYGKNVVTLYQDRWSRVAAISQDYWTTIL